MSEAEFKYTFFGRVTPEHLPLGMSNLQADIGSPFYSFTLEWLIQQNHLVAVAYLDEQVEEILTLRNIVQSRIQPMVDGLSFQIGRPYDVILEYVSYPDGGGQTLLPDVDVIKAMSDDSDWESISQKIIACLFSTPGSKYLELALSDFARSMTSPEETGFHCQRAFESIRHYFEDEFNLQDSDDIEKWEKLWDELEHDNTFIMDTIVPMAKDRRHGRSVSVSAEERGSIFEETWIVIRKFLDYLIEEHDPERPNLQFVS